MKSNALPTSSSSARSGGDRSETTRDVCYFPGCRKDMNCNCEICLASISATLDLMPSTAQKSSLTKLSFSGLTPERTPISFSCRTPETRRDCTPGLRSTAKSRPPLEEKRRTAWCRKFYFARFLVGVVSMFLVVDPGYRWTVSEIWGPAGRLSPQTIQRIGEESGMLVDLHDRLGFVQRMLEEELIHGKVFNCTAPDSVWEFNQDGFIHSRCILYKSRVVEVSIWGWPLQTAGLLATGFSSRSFTVLSGRVTEWSRGKLSSLIRKENSSWIHKRWTASAIQLDRNTWILEYQQSAFLQNSRPMIAVLELLKLTVSTVFYRLVSFPYHEESWRASLSNLYFKDPEGPFTYPT